MNRKLKFKLINQIKLVDDWLFVIEGNKMMWLNRFEVLNFNLINLKVIL